MSDISTLIVYLKAQLETSGEPQFLFLDLVELTNGESADEIHKALVACLKRHGFDMDYLQEHFIAFTSDGASVLTGKKSGVMELLVKDFPNLITWHCLNHRLELAVDDAIADLSGINHFKIFIGKLHSVYSQSPKKKRELKEVAKNLDAQLLKIGKVLSTRWVVSSHRTVLAVWNNYEALYQHFKDKAAEKEKQSAMYDGVNKRIQSPELIEKLLDAMRDRLFATNAAGTVRNSDAYQKLFDQVCVLYPTYWPQYHDFNYDEEEVRSLCNRFGLARSSTVSAFQYYVDSQGRQVPDDFKVPFILILLLQIKLEFSLFTLFIIHITQCNIKFCFFNTNKN